MIFAGSLPATRAAVVDFDAIFLTCARACIAAIIGWVLLAALRQPRPGKSEIPALVIVSVGCVIGFPLLTALALKHVTSAHSIVFVGLLPISTAIFAVVRGGERPKPAFWFFSILGSLFVASYAASGGIEASLEGDLFMLAAIVVCGLGYAEGAALSRKLGGWQVISWSLLLSLPFMSIAAVMTAPPTFRNVGLSAWIGFAYVSIFSMMIGFVYWYRGLAKGGIAAVGQLQLLQPFFGFALAAIFLHESVSWSMLIVTLGAVACVAGAKRYSK